MIKAKLLLLILVAAVLLQIISGLFNSSLMFSTFEKLYLEGLVARYLIVGQNLQSKIETAMRLAKPLDRFYGIDDLLKQIGANNPDIQNLEIFSADLRALYALRPDLPPSPPADVIAAWEHHHQTAQVNYFVRGPLYHVVYPLERRGVIQGYLNITFEKAHITRQLELLKYWNYLILAIIIGVTVLILGVALRRWIPISGFFAGEIYRRFNLLLFIIIGASVVTFSGVNTYNFRTHYVDSLLYQSRLISAILRNDIQYIMSLGIDIHQMSGIETLMERIIHFAPEVNTIYVLDRNFDTLYSASRLEIYPQQLEYEVFSSPYRTDIPIHNLMAPNRPLVGYIHAELDEHRVRHTIRSILLDSGTVVVIGFLLLMHLILILWILLEKQIVPVASGLKLRTLILPVPNATPASMSDRQVIALLRAAAFLFFFGYDFSISFVPLYMRDLSATGSTWLAAEILMGMPISAEMLLAALAVLFSGRWIDLKGWSTPYLAGVSIAATGLVISGLAATPAHLVFGRAVSGIGLGLVMMASQGYVFKLLGTRNRAKAIAGLLAGVFAGNICGSATGAMLAERIGFAPVFIWAAGISSLTLFFVLLFMRQLFVLKCTTSPNDPELPLCAPAILDFRALLRFIGDKNVLGAAFLSGIPGTLCLVGFLSYFSPVYLNHLGMTQSSIGRFLMLYGLSMVLLGPTVNAYIDQSPDKKKFVVLSGLLSSGGLLAFGFLGGPSAIALTIIMISFAGILSSASGIVMAVSQPSAQGLGQTQAAALYRSLERIGQIAGPVVFAAVSAALGFYVGIRVLGVAYLGMVLLYVLVVRENVRSKVRIQE